MEESRLLKKITSRKEYSELPLGDVKRALANFSEEEYGEAERIKLTREVLHKVFSAFASPNLLKKKNIDASKILQKHKSTKERLKYYREIYAKILEGLDFGKEFSIIDLGAGVNGFSYFFFEELGAKVNYTAIEGVGQLVRLMNHFFEENHINGRALHLSLFELQKIKKILRKQKKPRVVLAFKIIDSLESLQREFSKKLVSEILKESERFALSFATKSLGKKRNFRAQRRWIVDFLEERFKIIKKFEIEGERFIVFENMSEK